MLKNKIKKTEGFTIIELIMVVAVIALLVAIALVSLTVVRTKAGNSVIKNDVDQLRKFAEVMYAENGLRGYCADVPESCFGSDNARLNGLKDDIQKRNKENVKPVISCDADNFCISANLSDGSYYCVDSTAKQTTGDIFSVGGKCDPSTPRCQ